MAQLAGAAKDIECISPKGTPPKSVLDMTLNNLMVRLQ